MFYIPKGPGNVFGNWKKYTSVYLTMLIPGFDLWILMFNAINWMSSNLGEDPIHSNMYDNELTSIIYGTDEEPYWLFQYYDMFTWQGLYDFYADKYILTKIPLLSGWTNTSWLDYYYMPVNKNQLSYFNPEIYVILNYFVYEPIATFVDWFVISGVMLLKVPFWFILDMVFLITYLITIRTSLIESLKNSRSLSFLTGF